MTARLDSFLAGLALVGFCGALAIADETLPFMGQDGTTVSFKDMCAPGFAAVRRMPEEQSRAIKVSLLPRGRRPQEYELDHILPLCLGGTNDRTNLWLQPIAEARQKDKLEWLACRHVCDGTLTYTEAVSWFTIDGWKAAYIEIFHVAP